MRTIVMIVLAWTSCMSGLELYTNFDKTVLLKGGSVHVQSKHLKEQEKSISVSDFKTILSNNPSVLHHAALASFKTNTSGCNIFVIQLDRNKLWVFTLATSTVESLGLEGLYDEPEKPLQLLADVSSTQKFLKAVEEYNPPKNVSTNECIIF